MTIYITSYSIIAPIWHISPERSANNHILWYYPYSLWFCWNPRIIR